VFDLFVTFDKSLVYVSRYTVPATLLETEGTRRGEGPVSDDELPEMSARRRAHLEARKAYRRRVDDADAEAAARRQAGRKVAEVEADRRERAARWRAHLASETRAGRKVAEVEANRRSGLSPLARWLPPVARRQPGPR
jgi:hypothetical protein